MKRFTILNDHASLSLPIGFWITNLGIIMAYAEAHPGHAKGLRPIIARMQDMLDNELGGPEAQKMTQAMRRNLS